MKLRKGSKMATNGPVKRLMNQPNAPKLDNPNSLQKAELSGYWRAIVKHLDFVLEIQKHTPGWLPPFNPVF